MFSDSAKSIKTLLLALYANLHSTDYYYLMLSTIPFCESFTDFNMLVVV
jgi:hypothetical protein